MAASSRDIYWSAIITQFHRSGMSQAQFCRTRHLSIRSFRKWLDRLRQRTPAGEPRPKPISFSQKPAPARAEIPAFLPVHIRPEHAAATDSRQGVIAPLSLEVILSDHRRVRIPVDFDPATLRKLLEVLEEQS